MTLICVWVVSRLLFAVRNFANDISFIMFTQGVYILLYLDDLGSAEIRQDADFAF